MQEGLGTLVFSDIDPTLKRVMFSDQDGRLSMWDLESQKRDSIVARSGGSRDHIFQNESSPDGTEFVTSWPLSSRLANELYAFHMDGNLKKINQSEHKICIC